MFEKHHYENYTNDFGQNPSEFNLFKLSENFNILSYSFCQSKFSCGFKGWKKMSTTSAHLSAIYSTLPQTHLDQYLFTPDVAIALMTGQLPITEVPHPADKTDPIQRGLFGLKLFYEKFSFDPSDQVHVNTLNFLFDFILQFATDPVNNYPIIKLAFNTLSNLISSISDPQNITRVFEFMISYIQGDINQTTIAALHIFSKWLLSPKITKRIAKKELFLFFLQILNSRDERIERSVLKCIFTIYLGAIQNNKTKSLKDKTFIIQFIKFASKIFD